MHFRGAGGGRRIRHVGGIGGRQCGDRRTDAINATADAATGAVYLYDGDSSDDGVYTQFTYGQLIHVFADPNPELGDEFGAAIATVGTDLLIGAPGSSLTGPGDGVAYLFDADPTDPTFGALLATFTLPDR